MKGVKFTGILPAFITPLKEDNKTINAPVAELMVDKIIEEGGNGFYILGGTGEGLVLNREQREELCEIVVKHNAGRKSVITHVASMNLDEACELAKHAERVGADAISAVPPIFFHYDSTDIYNYYKKLASSTNLPLVIYYNPAAQTMNADLIAKLFEIDNVTGVKWTTYNFFELMKLKEMTQGDMNIINGPDEMLVCGLAAGADAGIGATYTTMLPDFVRLYNCVQEGKIEEARQIQYKVNRVIRVILKNEVIPATKYAATMLGYDVGAATDPMRHYTEEQKRQLEAELRAVGFPFHKI